MRHRSDELGSDGTSVICQATVRFARKFLQLDAGPGEARINSRGRKRINSSQKVNLAQPEGREQPARKAAPHELCIGADCA